MSYEKTRIDDTLMEVTNDEKESIESNKTDESIQRSEFRDEQIRVKEKQRLEEEEKYKQQKKSMKEMKKF